MTKSNFIIYVAPIILSTINIISLCSGFLILCVILILAIYRRQALDRVTLRFQGIVALIDIARHIAMINVKHHVDYICKFVAFSVSFLNHIYVFINVLIALNMQLIYIHHVLPKPILEIFFMLGAIILAFVIDLIPFAYAAYGKNHYNICYLVEPHPFRFEFKVLLKYATITPGLVYCVIIFLWVVISLYQRRTYIQEKFPSKSVTLFGETINGRDFIRKLYFRMALYPISSVVSFLPYLVSNLYRDTTKKSISDELFFVFDFCARLTGFMNLVSLLFDPHFQVAVKNIYKNGLNSDQNQSFNLDLNNLGKIKKEDEYYLINIPGEESIRFEDYIKFL